MGLAKLKSEQENGWSAALVGAGVAGTEERGRQCGQRSGKGFEFGHDAVWRGRSIGNRDMAQTTINTVLRMVMQRRCLDHLHASQHEQHQGDESVTAGKL